jgi:hypothetical protein
MLTMHAMVACSAATCDASRPPYSRSCTAPCSTGLSLYTSLNNVAAVLVKSGDLRAARANLERALAIAETLLGPKHPDEVTFRQNLASVLRELGKPTAAGGE